MEEKSPNKTDKTESPTNDTEEEEEESTPAAAVDPEPKEEIETKAEPKEEIEAKPKPTEEVEAKPESKEENETNAEEIEVGEGEAEVAEGGDEEDEGLYYGSYLNLPEEELNDEDAEAAFMKRYEEEFGAEVDLDDENVMPEIEPQPIPVKSLDEMIRLLQEEDENKEEESDVESEETEVPTTDVDKEDKVMVLGPEHPKMKRFQAALKKHLEKQIYLAECEERDLENEVKMKRKEREDLGIQLYNLQYELTRQSETLAKYETELEQVVQKRIEVEAASDEIRLVHQKLQDEIKKEIDEEQKVMAAVKEMDLMEWCVRQAAREYEGEILISQKLDEQYEKLRSKTEIEKQDQDFYLDRIMSHVQRMEQSNAGIQRQIQAHLEEQKDLNALISEAGTEIEALQIEKVHLSRAWNETISVVRARDEALNAARSTLLGTTEELRNKESELRSVTRAIAKEQEKHEELTVLLKRRKMEDRHLNSQLATLENQAEELEQNLTLLQNIRAQVEGEYKKLEAEMVSYEKLIDPPRRKIQLLNIEKAKLEDEILHIIQEQTAMDKVAQGIAKKIEQGRAKTRMVEGDLAKVENEMTAITVQCEKVRTELLKKRTALEELEKKLTAQEKILSAQAADIKYSDKQIQKKTNEIEGLTRKLNKLIGEQGGVETGPLEQEIEELERQISSNRTLCVELQETWLKLQDDLVQLTNRRDTILNENDLIRKETFIMDRKRQRIEIENDAKKAEITRLEKAIELLRCETQALNSKLYEGKAEQEQMDRENVLVQNELVHLLKDAEMEAIDLQDEIINLEEEKERQSAALAESHEQCLLWEKKVKLARELKDSIKKEQETSTSSLRLAIHHMQVRFNELKRAQEKIMSDLEQCIEKREQIIQQADLNMRRNNIHPRSIKLNIQRDEQQLKEKNRQIIQEAYQAEDEIKDIENKITQLDERVKCETEALSSVKQMIGDCEKKINEASIEKHKYLIELLLRQMKYKVLEAVNTNRFRVQGDETSLEEELRETEKRCYAIVNLCDVLLAQFPEHELNIKLVKASILPNVQ